MDTLVIACFDDISELIRNEIECEIFLKKPSTQNLLLKLSFNENVNLKLLKV